MSSMAQPRYLKTRQFVPGKGMSFTFYEIDTDDMILRMLTHLPDQDEVVHLEQSQPRKLFAPERCEEVDAIEFEELWQRREGR